MLKTTRRKRVLFSTLVAMLKGLKILLGVSGGIATYKSCELLRLLQKEGAEVRVAMTHSATQMVGVETFQALSRYTVSTQIFNSSRSQDWFEHIDLSRWADLMIIAPATANTLANIANGTTPDMVALMAMATSAPKMICPSMNTVMLMSPAVQRNIQTLKSDGHQILDSNDGILACGEVGAGRLPEPHEIRDQVILWHLNQLQNSNNTPKPNILITAGRTEEAIDPVRYISNKSSGKTALTFAKEFLQAGYPVKLLCGPIDEEIPSWINTTRFKSSKDLDNLLKQNFPQSQVLIQAAAVADYRPSTISSNKIKSSRDLNEIKLTANDDLLAKYTKLGTSNQYIVGFALETTNVIANAITKINKKGCPLLVVNNPVQADSGFGKTEVLSGILVQGQDNLELKIQSKSDLAKQVIIKVSEFFKVHS